MPEQVGEKDYQDGPCAECGHDFMSHDTSRGNCCEVLEVCGKAVDCGCHRYKED